MAHAVPMLGTLTVVSTQVCVPVEHDVVPWTHWFGFVEQGWLAVQVLQTPEPLQTMFVPQLAPGASGVAVAVHVGAFATQAIASW